VGSGKKDGGSGKGGKRKKIGRRELGEGIDREER
jgi:hypothetical protein